MQYKIQFIFRTITDRSAHLIAEHVNKLNELENTQQRK